MEWLTGLALLPALVCVGMMGGMALVGAIGWRRTQATSADDDSTKGPGAETTNSLEDARR